EFDDKINKYVGERKITMPGVKEGSVIEFEYTIKSPIIGKIRDWDFQTGIPVNYSEFKTYIPEYFVYNTSQKGFVFPKITVEKSDKSINYNYRDENEPGGTIVHSMSQEKLSFLETRTTYVAENLPAMKEESYVNNIGNYTSSIAHELSVVKYPNTPFKSYSTDWKTVTETIYKDDDFGGELNKTGYFETDVKALTNGLISINEIVGAIFNYVKTSVKWDGLNSYYCNDGVKAAYKNKTGNVAEINLMLTAMLRYSGINANPVLLSTRSNGIALFPNRTAFNYVIAAVETPDGMILLDATEKYSVPNVLPLRDLNWFGRLIRKDGSSIEVGLIPNAASKEITFLTYNLNPEGTTIQGKIRNQYFDHEALDFRVKNAGTNKDNYLETLENTNNSIEINDYVRDNDLDLSKPIVETYSFKDSKSVEIINGKIYIAPLLFLTERENPFKQEKREYPVDFGYPKQNRYNISIDIPQGYTIESMPKALNLVTGENMGAFKYAIGNTGNKIQITITEDINTAIISSEYYDVVKEFFQKIIDQSNEKIVLVKA
ncbi:MAG TPA: transglutaminase domain-containing protein, partial [Flavobacterium sp.]|nr:transglutaminase domain-containing protein [Flavobacterium sp.]